MGGGSGVPKSLSALGGLSWGGQFVTPVLGGLGNLGGPQIVTSTWGSQGYGGGSGCHPCLGVSRTWERLGGSPGHCQHLGGSGTWGGPQVVTSTWRGLRDTGGAVCYPYLGVSRTWGVPRLSPAFGGVSGIWGSRGFHPYLGVSGTWGAAGGVLGIPGRGGRAGVSPLPRGGVTPHSTSLWCHCPGCGRRRPRGARGLPRRGFGGPGGAGGSPRPSSGTAAAGAVLRGGRPAGGSWGSAPPGRVPGARGHHRPPRDRPPGPPPAPSGPPRKGPRRRRRGTGRGGGGRWGGRGCRGCPVPVSQQCPSSWELMCQVLQGPVFRVFRVWCRWCWCPVPLSQGCRRC